MLMAFINSRSVLKFKHIKLLNLVLIVNFSNSRHQQICTCYAQKQKAQHTVMIIEEYCCDSQLLLFTFAYCLLKAYYENLKQAD